MWNFARWASILAIIGTAAASPAQPLAGDYDGALTPELFDELKFYAQHAGAVYCNVDHASAGDAISCTNNGCPRVMKNNATLSTVAKGFVSGIGAYVAVDHVRKEVVVSVRGTTNIRNFATDIRILRKDIDNVVKGGEVHAGFLAAWNEISETILSGVQDALETNSGYRLVAVGHSLGSGTAAVGASYLRQRYPDVDFFGYGMPRVGNAIFADFFSHDAAGGSTYRIENYNDAAPAIVPRFLGYKHTETEYWLSTGPANKVDYAIDEIKVCKGDPNDCSGSLPIKDITGSAHRYILSDLYACGGLKVIP